MPDDMTTSNIRLTRTTPANARLAASRFAAFALLLVASTFHAHAQDVSRKPTGSDQTNSKATTAAPAPVESRRTTPQRDADSTSAPVRARRVSDAPTVSTPAAPTTSSNATATSASNLANVSKATTPAVDDAANARAEAELEGLRAQIIEAKTDADRARLQRALAERLVELNRTSDAITVLRASMREERFDPIGLYNTGNALARLDDLQAAAEAYRKAIGQKNGSYSRAQNNLGVVLMRLGRWDDALEALTAALRLETGNYPEASYNVGRLYALRGEAGRAIEEWQRTLALQPDHTDAAISLALAYAADGNAERGLKVLDAFAARFKRRGDALPREIEITRGEIVASSNLSASERKAFSASERNAAASASTMTGATKNTDAKKSRAASASMRPEATRRASKTGTPAAISLTLGKQTYDLLQRARAARDAGRNEQAAAFYRRVISEQDGYFAPANLELGYSLTSLQQTDDAIETFRLVAAKDGARFPIAFYHLARLYEKTGRLPLAAEAFSRAAALYGDTNPQMLLDLSRVREKEGNPQAALSAMQDYTRSLERLGSSLPDWARERLAQLRQQANATPTAQNPSPKQ